MENEGFGDSTETTKKRSINFSPREKTELMELLSDKYAGILEDKKTDRASIHLRMSTWKKIENEFNATSSSGIYRDWATLKRLYDNRKREVRKLKAKETQNKRKTGGGPETKTELDPADEMLLNIMNKKTVQGFDNPFDCDGEITPTSQQKATNDFSDETEFVFIGDNEDLKKYEEDQVKWKRASDLQKRKNPALCTSVQPSSSKKTSVSTECESPVKVVRNSNATKSIPQTPVRRSTVRQHVKNLSSSNLAKMYDILLDRRAVLVEKQIEKVNQEIHYERVKNKLEIELLTLEVAKKKKEV